MALIRFAVPKGSLEKETFAFLARCGYDIRGQDRTYRPVINDRAIELKLLRPQEIPLLVAEGLHDLGITGIDWIRETEADVEILANLDYGRVRLVVAVPQGLPYRSLNELMEAFWREGRRLRISTEFLNLSARYIMSQPSYQARWGDIEPLMVTPWWRRGANRMVEVFLSFGATEAKPPDEADAIIDLTATGTTLERNGLKALDTILESSAVLVANREALKDRAKREKIYDVVSLARGVVDAKRRIHVFLNVKKENLEALLAILPALKSPTISPLGDEGWVSVNTVMERATFLEILPKLRRLAQGLVVHEPKQILPLEDVARDEAER
jgi:ATP phosphoribosyltransferase